MRLIEVVVALLVSVGALLLYLRTHDAQTAGQAGTQKSGKADGALRWGEIQTLSKRGKVGVPAVAYDPVVGTVAAWPRNNDLELRREISRLGANFGLGLDFETTLRATPLGIRVAVTAHATPCQLEPDKEDGATTTFSSAPQWSFGVGVGFVDMD